MSVKDSKTEQLIKDTAKRIFLTEGKMLATTQDIADAARVNRTLLHYYFRSKDVLFDLVFKEALAKLRDRLHSVLGSTMDFRAKIENFIDVFFEELSESPYLETFIVLHLNQDPGKFDELFVDLPGRAERIKNFFKEIKSEMEKGAIAEMKPIHFYMNLFALITYPLIARPIYQNSFKLNDADFTRLFKERKKVIMTLLFRK